MTATAELQGTVWPRPVTCFRYHVGCWASFLGGRLGKMLTVHLERRMSWALSQACRPKKWSVAQPIPKKML